MSNRKKAKNRKLLLKRAAERKISGQVDIPEDTKVVAKEVPATIHWDQWDQVDRDDTEVVGKTIVYEDGTFDVIVAEDISDDAKVLFANFDKVMGTVSIDPENN